MDSDDAAAGLALLGVYVVFGVVIAVGWVLYKIIGVLAHAIRDWKQDHDRLKWERERAKRMVEAHNVAIRKIDETVDYYTDLHAYVAEKVDSLPA